MVFSKSMTVNCSLFEDLDNCRRNFVTLLAEVHSGQVLEKHILMCGCFGLNRNTECESSKD